MEDRDFIVFVLYLLVFAKLHLAIFTAKHAFKYGE